MSKKKPNPTPPEIPIRQFTEAYLIEDTPRRNRGTPLVSEKKRGKRMVKYDIRVKTSFQWRDPEGVWHDIPHVRDDESFERARKGSGYQLVKA